MALSWNDFTNGETLANIRSWINSFNTAVVVDVNKNTTDIVSIRAGEAQNKILLTPQGSAPTHAEGNIYYDDLHKAVAVQTDIEGYPVHVGTDTVFRVINKTGIIIEAGQAIRNGGIDSTSGQIKAELAKADSLITSFVIGFASNEIAIDAEGWVVNQGHVHDLNTLGLLVGKTLFLSDTVAGGVVQSPPDIASALGTVMVVGEFDGVYFTKINNLITYPQATGYLRGQNTPTYTLTTTPQDIVDYTLDEAKILSVDKLLGTLTVPLDGLYQITFTAVASFTSLTSTRTVYFELYNETTATLEGAYPRNIPRDATEEGISFTAPFSAISGHIYKMRIRASLSMSLDIDNAAFIMTSHHLG